MEPLCRRRSVAAPEWGSHADQRAPATTRLDHRSRRRTARTSRRHRPQRHAHLGCGSTGRSEIRRDSKHRRLWPTRPGTTSHVSRSPRSLPLAPPNPSGVPADPWRPCRNPEQRTKDPRRDSQRRSRRIPPTSSHSNAPGVPGSTDSRSSKSAQTFISWIPLRRMRTTPHQPFKPRKRHRTGVPQETLTPHRGVDPER